MGPLHLGLFLKGLKVILKIEQLILVFDKINQNYFCQNQLLLQRILKNKEIISFRF